MEPHGSAAPITDDWLAEDLPTSKSEFRLGRVLVIDDEEHVCQFLEILLRTEGMAVDWSTTGADIVARYERFRPDVVLVDLGLADISGIAVCRMLRQHSPVPILVVSGHDGESAIVAALQAGADGYVVKPARPMELVARIRSMLRREPLDGSGRSDSEVGPISVDRSVRTAAIAGKKLDLLPREFDILEVLVRDAGVRVTPRTTLLQRGERPAVLDGHVRRLRAALEAEEGWRRLVVVRGVGFRLLLDPEGTSPARSATPRR